MTPTAALLARNGWSAEQIAPWLGRSPRLVRCWVSGRNARGNPCAAPPAVDAWLLACALAREGVPVPVLD